jgi:hypothetical protein
MVAPLGMRLSMVCSFTFAPGRGLATPYTPNELTRTMRSGLRSNGVNRFLGNYRIEKDPLPFLPAARWKMSCTSSTARAASSDASGYRHNTR